MTLPNSLTNPSSEVPPSGPEPEMDIMTGIIPVLKLHPYDPTLDLVVAHWPVHIDMPVDMCTKPEGRKYGEPL